MPKILEGETAMKKKILLISITLIIILIAGGMLVVLRHQEENKELNEINNLVNTESKTFSNSDDETDSYGYKNLSELPQDYTLKQAIQDGCVIITYDKIFNKYKLDNFIENTGINSKNRKEDKIRIVQYTVAGDAIIKDLEYKIKDETYELGNEYVHKTTYVLTTDNTRDKFAEADRKITVDDDIPGDVYGILKVQQDDKIAVMLGIYAQIDYIDLNVKRYEEIEVCEYRKSIEDNEVTIMEE